LIFLGAFGSTHTVLEYCIKRLSDDGTRVQDLDKVYRMAYMWLVYLYIKFIATLLTKYSVNTYFTRGTHKST